MLSALSSAQSGLTAFGTQLRVSANNTANVLTEGFNRSRVVLAEARPQGVQASIQSVDTAGPQTAFPPQGQPRIVEPSNVDLAQEVVTQLVATRAYQANLATIRAEDQRIGSLLDIRN